MKCKKLITGIIGISLLFALCLPNMAFAKKTEDFTLRVGYWPGYGMTEDESGRISGYAYEYMKEIAEFNNWNVEFISCGWTEGLTLLSQGKIDTFGPLEKLPEREALYAYPSWSMGEEYGALYARADNNSVFYDDPKSIGGKVLGTMENNYFSADLEEYCRENQISPQIVTMDSAKKLDAALTDGSIDLRVTGSLLLPADSKLVLRFDTKDFYYPTTKGNTYVLDGLNKALAYIQTENSFYNARLYDKYYTRLGAGIEAFTAGEADFIRKAPVLRIGYKDADMPIEYYDEKTHEPMGISIDLLREIERYSGLRFEFVELSTFEQGRELMDKGELQLISGLIGSEDFAELYNLTETDALMQNSQVFIMRQGALLLTRGVVMALPETAKGIWHHMEDYYPETVIKSYPDITACLEAVKAGDADLTVMSAYAANRDLKSQKYFNLTVNNMRHGDISICLGALPDSDPALISVLNKSITAIPEAVRSQIVYKHTIGQVYKPTPHDLIRYNLPLLCVGFIAFFTILYVFSLRSRRKLNALAFYDQLTGEMNLTRFKMEAQKLMDRRGKNYVLIVMDIDKFKAINGLYGYEFGDKILILIAKTLRTLLPADTLFCHGVADKFDLFLEYEDESGIAEWFDTIARKLTAAVASSYTGCNIALCGGACIILPEDSNIISVIDHANIARKQVKSFHQNGLCFYKKSMSDELNQIRTIENNMMASLKNGEFVPYLQPKIDLSTHRIAGAEALVRWQHPEKGLIPPNDFIPLFEENGFILDLDFYMLEQICALLERWKREGRTFFPISVNLSRRHLFHTDTVMMLSDIVAKYDVDPSFIEVELTESAFDNCNVAAINVLFDALHSSGFTVSVDDFGAGYSSLSLLKDLPIDVLKIDKSFFDCHEGHIDDKAVILLESVITLSHRLYIKTVSEGVETDQQIDLLAQLGCDLVQGYYFAKPMPVAQLETILESGDLFVKAEEY